MSTRGVAAFRFEIRDHESEEDRVIFVGDDWAEAITTSICATKPARGWRRNDCRRASRG